MISASTLKAGSKKSNSPAETLQYGIELGRALQPGDIVAFFGDLGAGKTTLIKGIASGYANVDADEVQSPTFSYHHIYGKIRPVHHFDLYRLPNAAAFLAKGFDDYLYSEDLCLIEWSERIENLLPSHTTRICLSGEKTHRLIEVL